MQIACLSSALTQSSSLINDGNMHSLITAVGLFSLHFLPRNNMSIKCVLKRLYTGRENRFSTSVAQNEDQDSYWKDLSVTGGNGTQGFSTISRKAQKTCRASYSDPSSSLTGSTLKTATLLLMTAHESFGFLVSTETSL